MSSSRNLRNLMLDYSGSYDSVRPKMRNRIINEADASLDRITEVIKTSKSEDDVFEENLEQLNESEPKKNASYTDEPKPKQTASNSDETKPKMKALETKTSDIISSRSMGAKSDLKNERYAKGLDTYSYKLKDLKLKDDLQEVTNDLSVFGTSLFSSKNKYIGTVELLVIFVKLGEINCEKQSFFAEIVIYTYWLENYLNSEEFQEHPKLTREVLKKCWIPLTQIENVLDDVTLISRKFVLDDSRNAHIIQIEKFRGIFSSPMNFKDAPFDTQRLSIEIKLGNCSLENVRIVDCRFQMHRVNQNLPNLSREYYIYQIVEASILSRSQQATLGTNSSPVRILSCYISRLPKYHVTTYMSFYVFLGFSSILPLANSTLQVYDRIHLLQQILLIALLYRYLRTDILSTDSFNVMEIYIMLMVLFIQIFTFLALAILQVSNVQDVSYALLLFFQVFAFLAIHVGIALYVYFWPLKIQREMKKREKEYIKMLEELSYDVKLTPSTEESISQDNRSSIASSVN